MTDPGITPASNANDIPGDLPPVVEVELSKATLDKLLRSQRAIESQLRRIADCIERAIPGRAAHDRVFRR